MDYRASPRMVVFEALDGAKAESEALGAAGSGGVVMSSFMQCAWRSLSVSQGVVGARWVLQSCCSSWGCYYVVLYAVCFLMQCVPCLFSEEWLGGACQVGAAESQRVFRPPV